MSWSPALAVLAFCLPARADDALAPDDSPVEESLPGSAAVEEPLAGESSVEAPPVGPSPLQGPVSLPASLPADPAPGIAIVRPEPDLQRGRALYRRGCASCHGVSGRGDGPTALNLDPVPRDLTRGVFQLRSTASGVWPTDEDLFRTITRGMPGTAMPGWAGLPAGERWQLVFFVKSLSPRFARPRHAPRVIPVPSAPPPTAERIARGIAVYAKMECGKCHGPEGRGDGPASRDLHDDRGRRVYPFDLTRGGKFKAGRDPESIYRAIHTGLDGKPMPSYGSALAVDETWDLVFYLRSLFLDEE